MLGVALPKIKAHVACPGTLKSGLDIFENSFPRINLKLVLYSISVAIKKGKRAGRILFVNNENPFCAAIKLFSENNIKNTVKIKILKVRPAV